MSVLSDRGTDRTFDTPGGNPTAGVRPVVSPARLVRDLVAAFSRARREGRGAGLGADPGANGRGGPDATRRARATGGVDLRNTWQVVAGSVLVPLGVVLILVAWYGSAHTPYVQQQIPYLVSGSFAGLGCMVLGGLLYWAHWLYRIYDQADLHHEEQLHALRETLLAVAVPISSVRRPPVLSTPGPGGQRPTPRPTTNTAPPGVARRTWRCGPPKGASTMTPRARSSATTVPTSSRCGGRPPVSSRARSAGRNRWWHLRRDPGAVPTTARSAHLTAASGLTFVSGNGNVPTGARGHDDAKRPG